MNIPLNILDNYAKTISTKQANMLYEHKCNKKYKKSLYENLKYQNDNSYKLYLDSFTLDNINLSVNEALAKYVNKHQLQYNVVDSGVYLYTPEPENYLSLLENLVHDGMDMNILKEIVNYDGAIKYLENLK